ncbi:MAG: hypothetical protein ACM4D3_19200 [Candidatus Sericytochromatia bacterium]
MDAQAGLPIRIVVMGRPGIAREVEVILRGDGHEVYRTPDDGSLVALVARVRPHLVIISLDIPWADPIDANGWVERLRPVPVLLIGDVEDVGDVDSIPRISSSLDWASLRTTVRRLVGRSNLKPEV